MIRLLRKFRRAAARSVFGFFRHEIEGLITDRLMLFHEALVARGQILPPQRFFSGDQARLATGS